MAKRKSKSIRYAIGSGGATFLDLNIDASIVEILVNGPGMEIRNLVLVTSLSYADGYDAKSLRRFDNELIVASLCGHVGLEDVATAIRFPHQSPQLEFGVGSTGMYLNRLFLETKSGVSMASLIKKYLSPNSRKKCIVGLVPIQKAHGAHAHMTNGQGLVLSQQPHQH